MDNNNTAVRVRVPATSANLGPGFDSLGIALTLYNEVELELLTEAKIDIKAEGEGADSLPTDDTNMIVGTVQRLLARTKNTDKYRGIRLRLVNNIPLSRGLGSSAAAIVGGLKAANAFLGNPLDKNGLLAIATEIEGHPDNVAPAIFGGFTVNAMDGKETYSLGFTPENTLKFIVAVPDFTLSTKLARSVLPDNVPRADALFNVSRAALLVASLIKGKADCLKVALNDRLHQPYRKDLIPGFDGVVEAARNAGAIGCVLSGAGPSIIALTLKDEAAIGDAMISAFRKAGCDARALVLGIDREGAKIVRSAE